MIGKRKWDVKDKTGMGIRHLWNLFDLSHFFSDYPLSADEATLIIMAVFSSSYNFVVFKFK